jgi:ATP-binding cassette subfamily B protein
MVWRAARRTFLVSLLAEGIGIAGLAGVLLFGRALATSLSGDPPAEDLGAVLPSAIGLAASLLASGVAAVVVRHVRWLVAEQVTRHVKEQISDVASSVDYQSYEDPEFHDLLSRSDAQASDSSYQLVYDLLGLANLVGTSLIVVGVLVRTVPSVLPALVLIAVPSIVAARASARLAFQTTYELTPNDRLRGYLFSALTGKREARELRVFGIAHVLRNRWDHLYDERMRRIRSLVVRQVLFNGLAVLIGALLVGGVLLVLVEAAIADRISLADAGIAIVALQQLTSRLRSAATTSGSLRQSTLFLEDFERFRHLRREPPTTEAVPTRIGRGRLRIEHVSFRYPGTDVDVLDDVSLEVAPGEIVALVGASGSGKTTLAHLVARLYQPTAGRITLDGADIAELEEEAWWRSVAVVFQDFVRYELTAKENVTIGDHDRSDDRSAEMAADTAGIGGALRALPRGWDTMLSRSYEGGADLSVGQWQRVAVARAFYRDAPLLILDEPAAALDAIAEHSLHERLVQLCTERSVLVISHRFSTVRMADRICVMEAGRVVEQGTHTELIALRGRYAELFELQASTYLDDPSAAAVNASRR